VPPPKPTLEQLAKYAESFNRGRSTLLFASASLVDAKGVQRVTASGLSRLSSTSWAADGTPAVN